MCRVLMMMMMTTITLMSQVWIQHKEHENELFPCFIANLDPTGRQWDINHIFNPPAIQMSLFAINTSICLAKSDQWSPGFRKGLCKFMEAGGGGVWSSEEERRRRKVCRLRRKTTKRAKRKLKDCYKGMDEDNRKEEEGKDQGWWLASPQ